MPTQLTLIRHATTDANINRCFVGQVDPPLNEQGLQEASALANRLSSLPVDRIVTSDLQRAIQTAEAIAAHHESTPLVTDARLREMNLGELDGLPGEQVVREYPDLIAAWKKQPATIQMPGESGESLKIVQARVWQCVDELVSAHPDEHIVIVSHTFSLLALICRVIALDLNRFRHLFIRPASISILEWREFGPILTRLNDDGHLNT
jgi:broad specificity phosphatase PhoE